MTPEVLSRSTCGAAAHVRSPGSLAVIRTDSARPSGGRHVRAHQSPAARRRSPVDRPARRRRRPRSAFALRRDVLARRARADGDVAHPPVGRGPRSGAGGLRPRPGRHRPGDGSQLPGRPVVTVQQGAAAVRDVRPRPPDPRWVRRAAPRPADRLPPPAPHARRTAGRPCRLDGHRGHARRAHPGPPIWRQRCSTSGTTPR